MPTVLKIELVRSLWALYTYHGDAMTSLSGRVHNRMGAVINSYGIITSRSNRNRVDSLQTFGSLHIALTP